jgi:hypothetical protein
MYPTSKRKWMAAVAVVLFWVFLSPAQVRAHGGGHGGGGAHCSGGHGGGGAHYGGGGAHSGGEQQFSGRFRDSGFSFVRPDPEHKPHLIVDSPGFPEDLPEAHIHRFLQQHALHPHLPHWLH